MSDYDPNYVPVKHYFLVGQKCVVFNNEGKILILKRSIKSGSTGWSLIGGGLEKGENPLDSIKREAMEEAQIEISDLKLISVATYEGKDSALIICYRAKTDSKEIKINWEHDEYKWIDPKDISEYEFTETIKTFIEDSLTK